MSNILKTLNDMVAVVPVKPPPPQELPSSKGRFAVISKASGELVASTVVFQGPDGFSAGDSVYFTPDIYNYPGVRKIMNLEGKEFILVPKQMIILKGNSNA